MEKVSSKAVHANHFWVCFTMIIFFGVNLIFNFILSLEGIIGRIKNMQRQESNFLSLFSIMVFHTEKIGGFGFIFVMEE